MEFEGISEGVGGEGVGIGQPSLVFGTICCLATKGGSLQSRSGVGQVRNIRARAPMQGRLLGHIRRSIDREA